MTRILIIYTGGTVGMMQDASSKTLRPIGFEEIKNNIPELERLNYQWDVFTFDPPLDSSDMNLEVWARIAGIIEDNYGDYSGFVILHGSDTDRKSTRLNSSHVKSSYAVFCLKKKKKTKI